MKAQVYIITIFAGLLLFACQSTADEQVQKDLISNTEDQRRLVVIIDSLEKVVYDDNFDLDEGCIKVRSRNATG